MGTLQELRWYRSSVFLDNVERFDRIYVAFS